MLSPASFIYAGFYPIFFMFCCRIFLIFLL